MTLFSSTKWQFFGKVTVFFRSEAFWSFLQFSLWTNFFSGSEKASLRQKSFTSQKSVTSPKNVTLFEHLIFEFFLAKLRFFLTKWQFFGKVTHFCRSDVFYFSYAFAKWRFLGVVTHWRSDAFMTMWHFFFDEVMLFWRSDAYPSLNTWSILNYFS